MCQCHDNAPTRCQLALAPPLFKFTQALEHVHVGTGQTECWTQTVDVAQSFQTAPPPRSRCTTSSVEEGRVSRIIRTVTTAMPHDVDCGTPFSFYASDTANPPAAGSLPNKGDVSFASRSMLNEATRLRCSRGTASSAALPAPGDRAGGSSPNAMQHTTRRNQPYRTQEHGPLPRQQSSTQSLEQQRQSL